MPNVLPTNIGAQPDAKPTQEARPPIPIPSSVPSELTYDERDHNEEAPRSFVDDEPSPNENRLAYFHKSTLDQVKAFVAQGEYSALVAISDHLGEAMDLVNAKLLAIKEQASE